LRLRRLISGICHADFAGAKRVVILRSAFKSRQRFSFSALNNGPVWDHSFGGENQGLHKQ
jgi:hypothetical protein